MLGIMQMVNPLWEWVVMPCLLVSAGYMVRPWLEERWDEIDSGELSDGWLSQLPLDVLRGLHEQDKQQPTKPDPANWEEFEEGWYELFTDEEEPMI